MAAERPDGAKPQFERCGRLDLQQRFLNAAAGLCQLKDSHGAARSAGGGYFPKDGKVGSISIHSIYGVCRLPNQLRAPISSGTLQFAVRNFT